MWAALVSAATATAATSTCAAGSTCADVDAARSLFLRWVNSTSIPGEYTTAANSCGEPSKYARKRSQASSRDLHRLTIR